MSRDRIFKTCLSLAIADGREVEVALEISYGFTEGDPGTYDEPGCGDSVEIQSIRARDMGTDVPDLGQWLTGLIEADTELADAMIAEAREQDLADRDDAAERRHADRMEF